MNLGGQQNTKRIPVEYYFEELSAEAYSDFTAPLFSAKPLGDLTLPVFSEGHYWVLDQGLFVLEYTGPVLAERTKSHISESEHLVAIERVVSGREARLCGDAMTYSQPGSIAIESWDCSYKVVSPGILVEAVYTPELQIGFDRDRYGHSVEIHPDTPTGRLAHVTMDEVFRALAA